MHVKPTTPTINNKKLGFLVAVVCLYPVIKAVEILLLLLGLSNDCSAPPQKKTSVLVYSLDGNGLTTTTVSTKKNHAKKQARPLFYMFTYSKLSICRLMLIPNFCIIYY